MGLKIGTLGHLAKLRRAHLVVRREPDLVCLSDSPTSSWHAFPKRARRIVINEEATSSNAKSK
ncbi:hypothetical protein H5410_004855, partial [Solanum commersonii]